MFKVPETIPQDLLLIQDIVADLFVPTPAIPSPKPEIPPNSATEDSIDSSGSDSDSGDEVEEIEADLLVKIEDEDRKPCVLCCLIYSHYCNTCLTELHLRLTLTLIPALIRILNLTCQMKK
jgi:hypothetical protein